MNTFKEGDIVQLTDPRFPWGEPDSTHYLLLKNNGPNQRLIIDGYELKQPDIWSLITVDGDRIGCLKQSTTHNMILVHSAVSLPTYSDPLPPI